MRSFGSRGDLDQDLRTLRSCSRSKEAMNPWPEWFYRPLWCTMIWMIVDHWYWSRSPQRNARLRKKFLWHQNVQIVTRFNNGNHSCGNLIVIYHTLGEICTSNLYLAAVLTALNHCLVSFVIVTVLTQYSPTKLTLQLFSLILSAKRCWRCIRVCHWRHGKVSVLCLTSVRNKRVDFMDQIWAFLSDETDRNIGLSVLIGCP